MVLEVDEHGQLIIPAEALQASPGSRFAIESQGDVLILRPDPEASLRSEADPEGKRPFWETATPEERVKALEGWVSGLPNTRAAPISAEALRREHIYDN